jgi:hypothetical protein
MRHRYDFQRHLARHRRCPWRTRIIPALLVLAALAALAMIEQLGETTSSIGGRLTVTARYLALGGVRPAPLPYLGMSTADLASHESPLAHRARLIGIAAGAGIVLAFEVGRAAVELQHG